MPGRLLVDGRLVDDEAQRGISWRRTVLFVVLMLVLIASNPANEGTTARILEKIRLHKTLSKWMGRQLSERSYWNRRTTNYFVLSVKERVAGGLEIGTAFNSMTVCTVEDPEWGFLCRKLKSLISHPGVEWWRLPHDQPPVVLHRVFMVLLAVACGAVVCGVRTHDDPLLSMFVPSTQQNPFTWLMQVYVDSNVLLYPVWERLYKTTTFQATDSLFRCFGSNDSFNFYALVLVLALAAAAVRLITGNRQPHGWLIFLVTMAGYFRGAQQQQPIQQAAVFEDPTQVESDVTMLLTLRLFWFMLINGLANVGPVLVTIVFAFLAGSALGDYHYSQQVWQVWAQSWSKMLDDAWNHLFGRTPGYRAYY